MKPETFAMDPAERLALRLRALYRSYGYLPFRMSKFEEYDLYAHNKDFLISDSILTFTDLSGKLMALKPDVTLSIVRSSRDDAQGVQKVYYTENVYRGAKNSHCFKEIMQAGLECIGAVDEFFLSEVLMLAAESLQCISEKSVLCISDLDLVSARLSALQLGGEAQEAILAAIAQKNLHELTEIARAGGAPEAALASLKALIQLRGSMAEVLPRLRTLCPEEAEIARLEVICRNLSAAGLENIVRFDFSIISNLNYYNGLVFQGYVDGVPSSVLSGGQYDRLMRKMNRRAAAVGFAVYLDALERLDGGEGDYDVDVLLLRDAQSDSAALLRETKRLRAEGKSVMVQSVRPEKLRCRVLAQMKGSEVAILEEYA